MSSLVWNVNWNVNWDSRVEELLGGPVRQLISNCWAVAPVRQYEMALKMRHLLPHDAKLSIQELVNMMPRNFLEMVPEGGSLLDINNCADILSEEGTVLEEFCPFTQNLHANPRRAVLGDRYKPTRVAVKTLEERRSLGLEDSFYTGLVSELNSGPVAVGMPAYSSYDKLGYKDTIYNPLPSEIVREWNNHTDHVLLATAEGRVNGLNVLHCQDSQGPNWGHGGGFITVARHVVTKYFSIDVEKKAED